MMKNQLRQLVFKIQILILKKKFLKMPIDTATAKNNLQQLLTQKQNYEKAKSKYENAQKQVEEAKNERNLVKDEIEKLKNDLLNSELFNKLDLMLVSMINKDNINETVMDYLEEKLNISEKDSQDLDNSETQGKMKKYKTFRDKK